MGNRVREKLQAGKAIIGATVEIADPDVSEWLAHMGFDWLMLDMEHGPLSYPTVQRMMQAMSARECAPIVRPATNGATAIKRILDMGAYGIIPPAVNTAKDAAKAVRACHYPPRGIRGYGPRRPLKTDADYLATVEDQFLIIALIETQQAVENAYEILSVPGIDAGVIGPFDLSYDMGFGSPLRWDEPHYDGVFDRIPWLLEKGHRALMIGEADAFLIRGARAAPDAARQGRNL